MKHEFAIFYSDLPSSVLGSTIQLVESSMVHRIVQVLRLKEGEHFILFTRYHWARVILQSITKKSCIVSVIAYHVNDMPQINCTVLLPVLKRESLESALYQCAAVGVTTIQLIYTQKTRSLHGAKELERLQKIIIAAAEQSKNFSFPELVSPKAFLDVISIYQNHPLKLYADPQGVPLMTVGIYQKKDPLIFMVGPEGDLTEEEKSQLKASRFVFCKLTRTVLTAEQAVGLLAGIVCLANN